MEEIMKEVIESFFWTNLSLLTWLIFSRTLKWLMVVPTMNSPHRNTVAFNAKSAGGERQSKLVSILV